MKKLKLLGSLSTMLALLLTVSVVDARGGRWSGIDPEISVNGQQVNVRIEWPMQFNCAIENTKVRFYVPIGSDHALMAESSDELPCYGRESFTQLETHSEIVEKFEHNMVSVAAKVTASKSFPVRVIVYLNGEIVHKCGGYSNEVVRCGRVYLGAAVSKTSSSGATDTGASHSVESFRAYD